MKQVNTPSPKCHPGKPPQNRAIFDGVPKSWTHPAAKPTATNVNAPAKTGGK